MKPSPHRTGRGFSLFELLITLMIAAVLAAIALPTYNSYVLRARRVAGRSLLLQTAHWLERAAAAQGFYPHASTIPVGLLKGLDSHYELNAVTGKESFELKAVPDAAQAIDPCGTLGLLHTGQRTISNATPDATVDACWNR